MKLDDLLQSLAGLAPLDLAESWDNVGLIIEPRRPRPIRSVLFTIDLTLAVLEEAVQRQAGLVVAYHPPLFQGVKQLNGNSREAALALEALRHNVAVYSPHTALDAAEGGVNDWLCEAFGPAERRSLRPHAEQSPSERFKLVTFLPERHVEPFRRALTDAGVAGIIGDYSECSYELRGHGTFRGGDSTHPAIGQRGQFERIDEVRLEMVCPGGAALQRLSEAVRRAHPYETPAWDLYRLEPKPQLLRGQGRLLELRRPLGVKAAVARIKQHLALDHVRLARADVPAATRPSAKPSRAREARAGDVGGRPAPGGAKPSRAREARAASIRTIALCAGAGGSVLSGVRADLYLTGEMRHHDVLAATARGTHVILTDHTNSERGYLPLLAARLAADHPDVAWHVSRADQDPLHIV